MLMLFLIPVLFLLVVRIGLKKGYLKGKYKGIIYQTIVWGRYRKVTQP
jgi:hypothetical protein